jgi:hypothetical protein
MLGFDYLARFVCADLGEYEALIADLIDNANLGVAGVSLMARPLHAGQN